MLCHAPALMEPETQDEQEESEAEVPDQEPDPVDRPASSARAGRRLCWLMPWRLWTHVKGGHTPKPCCGVLENNLPWF